MKNKGWRARISLKFLKNIFTKIKEYGIIKTFQEKGGQPMDFESLEHLAGFLYILYRWYKDWQKEKRSKDKGKPRKQKPKSKKRNRR